MKKLFSLIVIIVIFVSCRQKVIIEELKEVKEQFILEGHLMNEHSNITRINYEIPLQKKSEKYKTLPKANAIFRISKTIGIYEKKYPISVTDAKISIYDEINKKRYNATHIIGGVYTNNQIKPKEGNSYKIEVNIEGKVYTNTAVIPKKITLQKIAFEKIKPKRLNRYDPFKLKYIIRELNSKEYIKLRFLRRQIPKLDNPESFKREDTRSRSEFVGIFKGGISVSSLLKKEIEKILRPGRDTIMFSVQSMNADMYLYYRNLQGIIGGGPRNKNPVNPKNNWKGKDEVLGYMLTTSISQKKYIFHKDKTFKEYN